jgi:hypothetical protein
MNLFYETRSRKDLASGLGRQGRHLSDEQRVSRVDKLVKRLFQATSANQELYTDVGGTGVLTVDFEQFIDQASTFTHTRFLSNQCNHL